MIQVENLTKAYGPTLAVDDISFSVRRGEIVCFAGKNGAGKSTTLRILAGALGATAGVARIGGSDVSAEARVVKRMVGYLPETPPLYVDMTVGAYLRFCARLRAVPDAERAVDLAVGRVGLSDVSGRLIANLSKGYRQRVGIAQAIVHEPKVLLLDEPVSGLDPGQRREVLDLVRTLASGDTTVLLSTHVLKEVEAICDRVLIIDGGVLVAQDTVAELAQATLHVRLVVSRPSLELESEIHALPGVDGVSAEAEGVYVVRCSDDVREALARVAVPCGLVELRAEQSLEDAFIRLTGA